MRRDMSYLIIRQLEIQNLGACFLSLATLALILCASVLLIDNADLVAQGNNIVENMQSMLDLCNMCHKAIGSKIQEEKSSLFT